ncbi:MAG: dTDP-glucose 4,6-dehydratase [Proteobacteria bacterium]|nr:dTDP-glucose 4,6-dehydratase [Pseudomonadota bacterium]
MKILVTGGAGFIGSEVCRYFVLEKGIQVINIDKLTYAANLSSLKEIENNECYFFEQVDICDTLILHSLFAKYKPDGVIHLAAESHVDRSIDSPENFIQTNIIGTYSLLEATRCYLKENPSKRDAFRFLHVSTDEVYGSLGNEGAFTEDTSYAPNSPYSASKASSDHLVRVYGKTYNLPVIISNCSNNYGPFQFPEKLMPLMVINILKGKPLPVYGDGNNRRDWLHVEDHVSALFTIFTKGLPGGKYNVGGGEEKSNLEVVEIICDLMDELVEGELPQYPSSSLIKFVADRPGHDYRYAMNTEKINSTLGWHAEYDFMTGIRETILWYLDNEPWWKDIFNNKYQQQRLGLLTS